MKKILKRLTGLTTAAAVFVYMPVAAFARPYDISAGDVNVIAEVNANGKTIYTVNGQLDETQIVISGDSGVITQTDYHVYIESRDRANALIVFENLRINNSTYAVKAVGDGNVTIELDGTNTLQSGYNYAGIQKENSGTLTIKDDDGNGSLSAQSVGNGAGIGGGDVKNASNIIIEGGTIEATGGGYAAGIGGGAKGSGSDITIKGGNVTAKGGDYAAGIGGGYYNYSTTEDAGKGMNITIEDGTVEAIGGNFAAGIGGGSGRNGENIVIGGGTVTAKSQLYGAGIGGGCEGEGKDITIKDGTVTAEGGQYAAGIGGGQRRKGDTITIKGGTVTAKGGTNAAGIGGGENKDGTNILIEGGTVTAIAGGNAAGIGGATYGAGEVEISGGIVIAEGGNGGGAGIGSGKYSSDASVTVSDSAVILASGGRENENYAGAAIGTGITFSSNWSEKYAGTEQNIDLNELYTTGSVTRFAAGTTVDEMKEHPELGAKETGTKPVPVVEENKEKEPVKQDTPENPKKPDTQPEKKTPPVYTERSYMADIDVANSIAAALRANAGTREITLEYADNICLSTDMMEDLFEDSRVAKNCLFSYKGKRYNMHVGAVNTSSRTYSDCLNTLAKEPDGLAGFMKMTEIFKSVGVTLNEINE